AHLPFDGGRRGEEAHPRLSERHQQRAVLELARHPGTDVLALEPVVQRPPQRRVVGRQQHGCATELVPPGASEAMLERADALTAYAIQTIREDAMGARPGTHLEVTLPAEASTVDLASVRDALAGLGRRGIAVSVRCDAPVS